MHQLPDLSQLNHARKDELIHALWTMVQAQTDQIADGNPANPGHRLADSNHRMGDFFGLPMSQGAIVRACAQAARTLTATARAIAQAFLSQPTVHADETGLRVNRKLHWMHALATEALTWVARHEKRGAAALGDLAILPRFQGTLVHDGWIAYRALECEHGLCNIHHVRELPHVHEDLGQDRAGRMIELLTEANSQGHRHRAAAQIDYAAPEYVQMVRDKRNQYEALPEQGEIANPRVQGNDQRGRVKQSKAANLVRRLRDHGDEVWRFMRGPDVPFTNNLAEQAVRMSKAKQKISGGFRTTEGADIYCIHPLIFGDPAQAGCQPFLMCSPKPSGAHRFNLALVDGLGREPEGWVVTVLDDMEGML